MAIDKNKMLPGFYVNINDTNETTPPVVRLKDVYTIYCILPEIMKSTDEFGDLEETYIEPNNPIVISSAEDAIKTLETTNLVMTREVRNIIRLIPNGSNIALVRIVKRNGDTPDLNSLADMYEALDYAFESTENLASREIIVAGLSLDDMLALDPNKVQVKELKDQFKDFQELVKSVNAYNSTLGIVVDKKFDLTIKGTKSSTSASESADGVHDTFEVLINDETAKIITEDGVKNFKFGAEISYTGVSGSKTLAVSNQTGELSTYLTIAVDSNELKIDVLKELMVKVDDDTIVKIKEGSFRVKPEHKSKTEVLEKLDIVKLSDSASLLRRTLLHNLKITSTQNSCYTFLSPEPPKSASIKDIQSYVDKCAGMYELIREHSTLIDSRGQKNDLGKFLSVVVGVNMYDGLGGLRGLPQAKVATISQKKVITKKSTTAFSVGDRVEVYTFNKMDTLVHSAKVEKIVVTNTNAVEITLDKEVPSEISTGLNPKYIMNVNNKDFKGTYLARQYSNVCKEVGVKRSPAGINFKGECQVKFSQKQLELLDSKKFCVIQQEHGQTVGSVSRSQLMTAPDNQFQRIETLIAVYTLIENSKSILLPYKGERIDDGTDLAIIKTNVDEGAFKPAVNEYILPNYTLGLTLGNVKNPNGVVERALFMNFEATEIQTLQIIRMSARIL
jgi:hypothetical protein